MYLAMNKINNKKKNISVVPCTNCITLPSCLGYLTERKELFEKGQHKLNISAYYFDSRSLNTLKNKCSLFKNYLRTRSYEKYKDSNKRYIMVQLFYKTKLVVNITGGK